MSYHWLTLGELRKLQRGITAHPGSRSCWVRRTAGADFTPISFVVQVGGVCMRRPLYSSSPAGKINGVNGSL